MSASERFDEFVKRQQPREFVDAAFHRKQKEEWLERLQQLYDKVNGYLKPYIDDGSIFVDTIPTELNEDGLGSYKVQRLLILIGLQEITLTPIGTMLIGSKGRVDVQGSRGVAKLSLVDKNVKDARSLIKVTVNTERPSRNRTEPNPEKMRNVDWTWKIVSAPPNITFIDLNKETFFSLIQEVSGG